MNILAIGNSSGAKSVGQLLSQKNLFHAKKSDASINSKLADRHWFPFRHYYELLIYYIPLFVG